MICSFTTIGSTTSIANISAIFVFLASIPVHLRPWFCFALRLAIVSIGSIPAFSAIVNGIVSNASANFLIASCSLPSKLSAHSLSCEAAYDSGAPPPATISGFSITSFTTIRAS